ncbi:MAG: hypothetical protein SGI77_11915 [Pirellulaceae bacterium]|nr:hypothetical protein [Pirellulaceae bacterium]
MIRSILTLTRDELEKRFFVREPFAVLTIRKPGSKFVRIPHKDLCVGECKLMFHDAESSPEMGRMRLLMPASRRRSWFASSSKSKTNAHFSCASANPAIR